MKLAMDAKVVRTVFRQALPSLAGLLILALCALPSLRSGHPVTDWPLVAVATPERIMALVGLGILIGQFPRTYVPFAIGVLVAAGASAYVVRDQIFTLLADIPAAAPNAFFSGPAAGLAVGMALVLPRSLRPFLAPPFLALAGTALMLGTALADPTLHALSYLPVALAFEAWLVFVFIGLARFVTRPFAVTGGQILASWMIAISLLYGGALVVDKQKAALTPTAFSPAPSPGEYPGFEAILQEIDGRKGRAQ